MGIMHQILDPTEWSVDALLKSLECHTCLDEVYNPWMVCTRKGSSVNLHPEYIGRKRQNWLVAIFPLKFLIIPESYKGFIVHFNGLLQPKIRPMTLPNSSLPYKHRQTSILSYGKYLLSKMSEILIH